MIPYGSQIDRFVIEQIELQNNTLVRTARTEQGKAITYDYVNVMS